VSPHFADGGSSDLLSCGVVMKMMALSFHSDPES
jgi:hypothetical protein